MSLGIRLNRCKVNCIKCKAVFVVVIFERMEFTWLAYVRNNFTAKFSTRGKCQQARTNTR